ncbi:chemotaxis protein CheW [Candidatus Thiodictyon syntrophicum]|uniref:Chemotaxis protein CheW n=1 Tax=Candidatus Thiodictyon syntrophicum TaxID=1166950 RepID=A0A2K8U3V2_9GAMM|nr:chemotaxis protein CheW [Candidatus Thiodictyon syntrophicum]AUB80258.1 chemotaxis protein CheW [Candidatus Thiodictyon syntrophicum]
MGADTGDTGNAAQPGSAAHQPGPPLPADPPTPAATLDAILDQRTHDGGAGVAVAAVTAQWVVFCIGERPFALPGRQVLEILQTPPIHFVPGCPPALEGVIEVRGTIWSVLRLDELLETAPGPVTRRNAILLGRAAAMQSGLRVDAVDDVLDLAPDAILAPPPDLPGRLPGLVTGVFQHRARAVLALDLERLFTVWRDGP